MAAAAVGAILLASVTLYAVLGGADRRGRHHGPPQPATRSCGTDRGP